MAFIKNNPYRQNGISIVEIMVSIAISLILLAGVMQIMLTNKQTYRVQEAFARLQENGRFAMDFLAKDIRMAGFFGCGSMVEKPNNLVDLDNDTYADSFTEFSGDGLAGFEYANLPLALNSSTSLTTGQVLPNTDILQIKHAMNTGLHIDEPSYQNDANIKLDPVLAQGMFNQYDLLFVTDCEKADIFVATGISVTTGVNGHFNIAHAQGPHQNLDNKLSKIYQNDAEVMKFVSNLYYVGNNSAGVPALFRASLSNNASISTEELVEGVEDLQILYGEDTDDDGVVNVYEDSASVTDFTKVVSARITLTVRTIEDNIATHTTAAGDKRLRRTFTTSIAIRNRVS